MMFPADEEDIAVEEETLATATRDSPNYNVVHDSAQPLPPNTQSETARDDFSLPSIVNEIENGGNGANAHPLPQNSAPPVRSLSGSMGNVTSAFGRWSSSVGEGVKKLSRNLGLDATEIVVRNPILFLFGDSLTEQGSLIEGEGGLGWIARVSAVYGSRADVLCRGFSGYNSRWGLRIFSRLFNAVDTECMQIVTIWFGTNDCVVKGQPQHVPVEEYRHNLAKMILYIREQGKMKITPILITPPPTDDDAADEDAEKNGKPTGIRRNDVVQQYVAACVELAVQTRVPCVDLHTEMSSHAAWREYLSDGVHLNSKGNAFVAEAVLRTIKKYVKPIDSDRLARSFPHWSEIDPDYPGKALGGPGN